jgi:hypothetical protein
MIEVLNRMDYRLRKVVKAKPQKAESVRSGSPIRDKLRDLQENKLPAINLG